MGTVVGVWWGGAEGDRPRERESERENLSIRWTEVGPLPQKKTEGF